jgi:hypothetical protein
MEIRGNSSQDSRPGMGNRGFNAGGNRVGQTRGFARPTFHRQFVARGGPQFHGSHGGGRSFDQCGVRGRGFDSSNRYQGHHQRWEEVHSIPNGQSFRREEAFSRHGAPSVDGTRGTESRWENIEPKQNSESRSGEVKFDPTSNMLDMTKLPLVAMALLQ